MQKPISIKEENNKSLQQNTSRESNIYVPPKEPLPWQ